MGISTDKTLRLQLIFFSILLMLTGLFVSRALLSISMFLFTGACLIHKDLTNQLMRFVRNPFLIGLCLLFLIPFITWFWSEDKEIWWRFIRIKLPLILFPLAFAGTWQLTARQWNTIAWFFLILVFSGSCWSLWQYVMNMNEINESYLRAKVIPTLFENDHVRFSLVVCMAVLLSFRLLSRQTTKLERSSLIALILFFVVFLHILSARTGLLSLYILLFIGACYLVFSIKSTRSVIIICLVAVVMPLVAWLLVPTFQNRIRYFMYDLSFVRSEAYLPGANDGNRIISIKAGWHTMQQHPFGTGAGDVMKATNEWYRQNIPGMLPTDKIYPSSEWMMYGSSAGWPGFILFTLIMLLPFFQRIRSGRFYWVGLNAICAFSFIFDIGLEVQFGVFIYVFMVLWWWKWMNHKEELPAV